MVVRYCITGNTCANKWAYTRNCSQSVHFRHSRGVHCNATRSWHTNCNIHLEGKACISESLDEFISILFSHKPYHISNNFGALVRKSGIFFANIGCLFISFLSDISPLISCHYTKNYSVSYGTMWRNFSIYSKVKARDCLSVELFYRYTEITFQEPYPHA